MTYPECCADPLLFGPWFSGESWARWRVVDKALFGLPLDEVERPIFTELTGRVTPPTEPATEAWFAIGRRGGKDVKAASLGVYLATIGARLYGYLDKLARGERGVVQILAVDRDQAKVCLGYARAFFEQPLLAAEVARETADTIELVNGLAIEITTNDKRRVRGRTVVAVVFDEVGHWRSDEIASPDEEVYAAVKPSMATIPGALLIGISSPYARRGLLYRKVTEHFGQDGRVLVVRASSQTMNPLIPQSVIDEAYERDPASAAAEYGGEFRGDVAAFVDPEAVRACVDNEVRERAFERQWSYVGFCDPSGGSLDSFTCAVAHKEGNSVVLDAVREIRPPFSPTSVIEEYAALLRSYHVTRVTGDRYGGEFPVELFRNCGIVYEQSRKAKSEIFKDTLPLINSRSAALLDHPKLIAQLVSLERRTGGRRGDVIDHPPGGHDDIANSACGALERAWETDGKVKVERPFGWVPQRRGMADPLARVRV